MSTVKWPSWSYKILNIKTLLPRTLRSSSATILDISGLLPAWESATESFESSRAAATPSVTVGTWVLWEAAFSTVWMSKGNKSRACNSVSPVERGPAPYRTPWSLGITRLLEKGAIHPSLNWSAKTIQLPCEISWRIYNHQIRARRILTNPIV